MSKHTVLHFTCLVTLLAALLATMARAQGQSGEIRGTVTDPSGQRWVLEVAKRQQTDPREWFA